MRCKRCGRENPSNSRRCRYCNTPFYGSYSNINMPQNRKVPNNQKNKKMKNQKSDTAIIAAIIAAIVALAIIFTTIIGVYAYQNYAPRNKGFSSGGGGGGIVSTVSNQVTPNNDNIVVTLDGEDPDVEIYSFNTDTYDILIGETKTITFTAEIFANIELSDTDVKVIDENNNDIGFMNDNGIDGDAVEGDGIYTLQKEFLADKQKNTLYYATAKNIISSSVNICYYRVFGDEDFAEAEAIVAKLKEISQPYLNEDLTVSEEKISALMNAVSNYLNTQKTSGNVANYNINNNAVYIHLKSGYSFMYTIEVSGCSTGGNQVRVASYAPFDGLRGGMETLYDEALDGTATNVGNTFTNYTFPSDNNYDLDEVSLNNLRNISNQKVVIWGGHGGYDDSNKGFGSSLMTGELITNSTTSDYSADITAERILTNYSAEGRNAYCVTGGFFDKYLGTMNGAFVYLSACHSGQDMIDGINHRYQLVQSFIRKGATTVIGNSESIYSEYTYKMERDTINRMCADNDGTYFTASEALEYAKSLNGSDDGSRRKARPIIFPQNNNNAMNFRFEEPRQGYVSGSVKDAESGQVIKDALVRVYKEGEEVANIRTDDNGYYNLKLNIGEFVLKITKGHYKSAKIGVNITENATIYNETFLMLKVGLNTGYANGTITNAVSGQTVSDVHITIRLSWNNKTGTVLHTTQTNENGYYEVSFVPGFYTMEYSKEGYIMGYKNIIIGIVDFEAQNAVISPEMPDDGQFRIVLSWSSMPKDLDSHLTGPTVDGDRFHLYYKYANTSNRNSNSDYYQLDLDNTDIVSRPNIPETTTIVTQLDGVYRYSVHDYTNRGNANSDAMSQSNATVNVYKGAVLVATYHVPPNVKGSIWTVFELSGDEIKPINKISNGLEDDINQF